ncbi:LysR substrate-binding domain-containing protein [Comamonas sp. C24C]
MNLRQIEVFRAVMLTGSMTDAAKLLHVSQPGVSRLIRHLEIQLGVALFERRNGRVVATAKARALYAEVENVYRGVHHLQDIASRLSYAENTMLRVIASASVGLEAVPRATAQLLDEKPNIKVCFESLPTREISRLLLSEEADLAISTAPLEHPALDVRVIGHWSMLFALPSGHPLADRPEFSLGEALSQRLIVYSHEAPQTKLIDLWMEQQGGGRQACVEVRSGNAACAMAAAGAGVAIVDDLSALAFKQHDLVFVPVPGAPQISNLQCQQPQPAAVEHRPTVLGAGAGSVAGTAGWSTLASALS